jgi:hypothetical protein
MKSPKKATPVLKTACTIIKQLFYTTVLSATMLFSRVPQAKGDDSDDALQAIERQIKEDGRELQRECDEILANQKNEQNKAGKRQERKQQNQPTYKPKTRSAPQTTQKTASASKAIKEVPRAKDEATQRANIKEAVQSAVQTYSKNSPIAVSNRSSYGPPPITQQELDSILKPQPTWYQSAYSQYKASAFGQWVADLQSQVSTWYENTQFRIPNFQAPPVGQWVANGRQWLANQVQAWNTFLAIPNNAPVDLNDPNAVMPGQSETAARAWDNTVRVGGAETAIVTALTPVPLNVLPGAAYTNNVLDAQMNALDATASDPDNPNAADAAYAAGDPAAYQNALQEEQTLDNPDPDQ